MRPRGKADALLMFQRDTGTGKDGFGGKTESWTNYASEYAEVVHDRGTERREAAQEAALQSATFRVLANSLTLALTPNDRIAGYLGANWDITSAVPDGRAEVVITAVRKAA